MFERCLILTITLFTQESIVVPTSNNHLSLIQKSKLGQFCVHFEVLDIYFPMKQVSLK